MFSRRSEFIAGWRAEAPILLGVIPFGLIYGVLAVGAGLPTTTAIAMSSIVFAGSSQFIAVERFSTQTPALVIVLITLVVNLRHMLYSASIAPYVQHLRPYWKWLLAYLLTDEAYAVAIVRYTQSASPDADHSPHKHWFFLGAGLALWSAWQMSTIVGVLLGAQVPSRWALDFTLALTFIAIVFPVLKDRAAVAAALSAGLVAVIAADLPYRSGLIVAAFIGIFVGLLVESNQ